MLPWAFTSILQPPATPDAVRRHPQTYGTPGSCRIRKAPRHMPRGPAPSAGSGPGQDMVRVSREQALWSRREAQAQCPGAGG